MVTVENGQFVKLTLDCWLLQFDDTSACLHCEFRNTPDCGGETLLKEKVVIYGNS